MHISILFKQKTKTKTKTKQNKKTIITFLVHGTFFFLLSTVDSIIIEANFCISPVPSSAEIKRNDSEVICDLGCLSFRA